MKYGLLIADNYIYGLCKSNNEIISEIDTDLYNQVFEILHNRPFSSDNYIYKLRADTLEWELVKLPEEEIEE